jgi:hypothetical protein
VSRESISAALRYCAAPRRLRRTAAIALTVGLVLTAINEGDMLAAGDFTDGTFVKIGLNFVVPFIVSNLGVLVARGG